MVKKSKGWSYLSLPALPFARLFPAIQEIRPFPADLRDLEPCLLQPEGKEKVIGIIFQLSVQFCYLPVPPAALAVPWAPASPPSPATLAAPADLDLPWDRARRCGRRDRGDLIKYSRKCTLAINVNDSMTIFYRSAHVPGGPKSPGSPFPPGSPFIPARP